MPASDATSARRLSCSSRQAGQPARWACIPGIAASASCAGELELDVAVELVEALVAADLGPARAEQRAAPAESGDPSASPPTSRGEAAPRAARAACGARRAASCRGRRGWCRGARRARRSARRSARARRAPRAGGASGPRRSRAAAPPSSSRCSASSPGVGPALANSVPASGSRGTSRPCHARRRSFTAASSSANLYAQVVKRLSPRKSSSRREDAHQRVVGRLDARCRPARRRAGGKRRPATADLEAGRAQQQPVQARDRVVPFDAARFAAPSATPCAAGVQEYLRRLRDDLCHRFEDSRAHRVIGVPAEQILTGKESAGTSRPMATHDLFQPSRPVHVPATSTAMPPSRQRAARDLLRALAPTSTTMVCARRRAASPMRSRSC